MPGISALLRSVAMERPVLMAISARRGVGGLPRLMQLHGNGMLYASSSFQRPFTPPSPRPISSSSPSPSSPPSKEDTTSARHPPVDFNNTKEAFKSKSFKQLLRTYFTYKTFSFNILVKHGRKLTVLGRRFLGDRLFNYVMKATIYGQFVAGENLDEIKPAINQLRWNGVRAILDYAVEDDITKKKDVVMEARLKDGASTLHSPTDEELYPQFKTSRSPGEVTVKATARTYFYEDEEQCDQNVVNFLSCINTAADVSERSDAFAAVKLTGLGRPAFLLRLSEVVEGTREIFLGLADSEDVLKARITPESFHGGLREMGIDITQPETDRLFRELDADDKGHLDIFHWSHHFQPGKELHKIFRSKKSSKVQPLLAMMTDNEKEQMNAVVRRARTLAECARDRGVRLMIDAEQTYIQPAIRHIAVNILMPEFNLSQPVIFSTVQCYLKRAQTELQLDLALSGFSGFCYGVKLVRGAYIEEERALAVKKDYVDPVWPNKTDTDNCYHHLLELMLKSVEVKEGKVQVMVATHNEGTVKEAIQMMRSNGIDRSNGSVVFGQLLGMCDRVTFPLGQAGYCAYKYMPYGPVSEVIPYLLRRANENKGMLEGAVREKELVWTELWRRIRNRN